MKLVSVTRLAPGAFTLPLDRFRTTVRSHRAQPQVGGFAGARSVFDRTAYQPERPGMARTVAVIGGCREGSHPWRVSPVP